MSADLERKFEKRLKQFFERKNVNLDTDKAKKLIDFLYKKFEEQGRFNKKIKFVITDSFVLNGLSDFLQIKLSRSVSLLRLHRIKRSTATHNYSDLERSPPQEKSKRGLIHLLGRKGSPKYKVTSPDGTPLTPQKAEKIKVSTSSFDISFSPFAALHSDSGKPRERAVSSSSATFEKDMCSSELALWRAKTPLKEPLSSSPHRITTTPETIRRSPKKLDFDTPIKKSKNESFEFSVTQEDVLIRVNAKRPASQKKVMGNISALETMEALGVVISSKQSGRNFHWAHRRGWSLGGDQTKENLDPMTAGSNYDTLFKIEAPIKKILFDDLTDVVLVKGEVQFHETTGLPFKITYRLSWNTAEFIEVVIDPMSHRVPTVDEHEMSKTFFGLSFGGVV